MFLVIFIIYILGSLYYNKYFLYYLYTQKLSSYTILNNNTVPEYSLTWTPDHIDVKDIDYLFKLYLYNLRENQELKHKISYILKNYRSYKVQYMGITDNGRKLIYCNFFNGEHSKWKDTYILIMDGGTDYFQVKYDIVNKTFSDLKINGES